MAKIRWPFGAADVVAIAATGTAALTIDNDLTIIDGVTTQATGNRTITMAAATDLKAGARVLVKSKTAATQTTIFSTGCIAPTITGVAGKTFVCELVYDGTSFVAQGTAVQID